jgi:hypothetical protein
MSCHDCAIGVQPPGFNGARSAAFSNRKRTPRHFCLCVLDKLAKVGRSWGLMRKLFPCFDPSTLLKTGRPGYERKIVNNLASRAVYPQVV